MSTGLYVAGVLAWFASFYFFHVGQRIETTVAVPGGFQGYEGVANLQMLHLQAVNFEVSGALGIVGAIFIVGGAIVGALEASRKGPTI